MPFLDAESTLSEAEMAPSSTSMGDKLSVIDSLISRTIYLLKFSDFLRFRTDRKGSSCSMWPIHGQLLVLIFLYVLQRFLGNTMFNCGEPIY